MTTTELLLAAPMAVLANWQVLEIWRHGSLFTGIRARLEARGGIVAELLLCTFCLSNWTAATLAALILCRRFGASWDALMWWPVLTLAIARASNVLNDLTHSACRTPRLEDDIRRMDKVGDGGDLRLVSGRGGAHAEREET